MEFKHKREVFNNLPSVRFEIQGIPLYDPRKDSTAGGSGSQRWATPATWTQTTNPIVMVYNIMRGIRLPDGNSWGGECAAGDLPLASWAAAMNECDVVPAGATAAQYRAGLEISVEEEPADVIEELLKACSGQIVDVGGTWKVRVGGPGLPVLFITDEDVLADQDQVLEPFPGLSDTWNGVHAAYPEPDSLWEVKDAPPRYNAAFEAADGGRRLVADLRLPAVPYRAQVQQLMEGWIREERRFRRHRLVLPPEAAVLEPLDAIGWSSSRHGYAAKSFEIFEMSDDLMTMSQSVGLRERDAGDYNWTASDLLPSPIAAPGVSVPPPITVPAFAASATVIRNATGVATRPAILMTWTGQEAEDARGLQWEVRVQATAETVAAGSVLAVASGRALVTEGILPETAYEVRAQLVSERATVWSGWISVTTPPVDYLDPAFAERLAELDAQAEAAADQAQAAALAAQAVREDHDALVAGFTGTLSTAFSALDAELLGITNDLTTVTNNLNAELLGITNNLTTVTSNLNAVYNSATGQVKATALTGYYTKAQTDSAISAQVSTLESQILSGGQVRATLLTGYYTKTQTDGAISAASTSLSSSITAAQTT
ncbi:phage tail protein, partial [Cereibacter sediminicola]|uniref:phage tail protein n=1 Tax=Cereibacter sediminicola TaxID=2584941 RepID=UPI001FE902E5